MRPSKQALQDRVDSNEVQIIVEKTFLKLQTDYGYNPKSVQDECVIILFFLRRETPPLVGAITYAGRPVLGSPEFLHYYSHFIQESIDKAKVAKNSKKRDELATISFMNWNGNLWEEDLKFVCTGPKWLAM